MLSVLAFRPVPAVATSTVPPGYWLVGADGGVFAYGGAAYLGSTGGVPLNAPVTGMASTPSHAGYWLVAADGGVFSFGDAPFFGSLGATKVGSPIVAMASTRDGRGYWLVSRAGEVFSFGDASVAGPAVGRLTSPAVAIVADRSADGYRVGGRNGEIISFAAPELGWTTDLPVVGMAATANGGWWAVSRAGAVANSGFAGASQSPVVDDLGSVTFKLRAPVVAIAGTPDDRGYYVFASDGGVFTFGDAVFCGSRVGVPLNAPIVGGTTAS
ncbi:MAG: hypothetical protein V7636_1047 [Actinomycetota bacterium]